MPDNHNQTLKKQLWNVANSLRGRMNADEYKNYILGFIFYKFLSEQLAQYVDTQLLPNDNYNFADIDESDPKYQEALKTIQSRCVSHLGYYLAPSELFSHLVKKGKGELGKDTFILEDLKSILNHIEQTAAGTDSEDDFKGLFEDVDLNSTKLGSREKSKNDLLVEVLSKLAQIDFQLEDTQSDVLGDAYEYLIGEFASGAGKKGGEFYTPPQVSQLLSKIVTLNKDQIRSVYDPTCGSGSLLLKIGQHAKVIDYYGQELNPTTYNLGRMNMILHGVSFDNFSIKQGDTLTEDQHEDLRAEAIVANPPFSAKWKSDADPVLAADERFTPYGRLAPKSAADYAFVTHMLYHLADNGTMAVVLPHGALFRSGAEGEIRRHIIETQNYLDAVIGLPANLFYGTSIPATIMVFKKDRADDADILFIDASQEFEKDKNQNKLTDGNITKIFDTYKDRKVIDKYSYLATRTEIAEENDYNLNIPRYVDTFEPEPDIDINTVAAEIINLQTEETKLHDTIADYCKQLGITPPFKA